MIQSSALKISLQSTFTGYWIDLQITVGKDDSSGYGMDTVGMEQYLQRETNGAEEFS